MLSANNGAGWAASPFSDSRRRSTDPSQCSSSSNSALSSSSSLSVSNIQSVINRPAAAAATTAGGLRRRRPPNNNNNNSVAECSSGSSNNNREEEKNTNNQRIVIKIREATSNYDDENDAVWEIISHPSLQHQQQLSLPQSDARTTTTPFTTQNDDTNYTFETKNNNHNNTLEIDENNNSNIDTNSPEIDENKTGSESLLEGGFLRRLNQRRIHQRRRRMQNHRKQHIKNDRCIHRMNRFKKYNDSGGMPCWIPVHHPFKLAWDIGTVVCSLVHAYLTHAAIRDRNFDYYATYGLVGSSSTLTATTTQHHQQPGLLLLARLRLFTELWFVLDILLHFVTEHAMEDITTTSTPTATTATPFDPQHQLKKQPYVLKTVRAVSARYLTTWFVVDVLSLVPGEWLFVRPIVARYQAQRRWHKWWRRSRAVTRVTTVVWHQWSTVRSGLTVVARQTGRAGVARLIRTLIQYLPKYLLVWRHMKAVLAIRILRQWHWMRKLLIWISTCSSSSSRFRSRTATTTVVKFHGMPPRLGAKRSHEEHGDEDDEATISLTYEDDYDESQDYSEYNLDENSVLEDDTEHDDPRSLSLLEAEVEYDFEDSFHLEDDDGEIADDDDDDGDPY